MSTFNFENIYIENYFSVLGRNEHNPNIMKSVNKVINDYYNKEKCVELGESSFQIEAIKGLLKNQNLREKDVDLLISGDLENQIFASSFASRKFDIPFLGIYSACSIFTQGLIIASTFLETNKIKNVVVSTSSSNLASEKQFRYPIEYGAIRKKVNTFTATGAVSSLITKNKSSLKIESATIGKVIDVNYKDSNNFGACMAPGAAETIYTHLTDTSREANYYDLILTGDLGVYGVLILKEYLLKKYKIKCKNIQDAGVLLFDAKLDDKIAGGSGPICLPLILFNKIIKSNYKKILLVGTGSLHSSTSCALKQSIPSISHIVSLEVQR